MMTRGKTLAGLFFAFSLFAAGPAMAQTAANGNAIDELVKSYVKIVKQAEAQLCPNVKDEIKKITCGLAFEVIPVKLAALNVEISSVPFLRTTDEKKKRLAEIQAKLTKIHEDFVQLMKKYTPAPSK